MKKLFVAVALLAYSLAFGAASKYDDSYFIKKSGSTTVVCLSSASVRAYSRGATVSSSTGSPGTAIPVYDDSVFTPGETIEINGYQATIATVGGGGGDHIDLETSLSYALGDRVLRVQAPVTVYRDEGLSTVYTQPITADSNGRVVFYTDSATLQIYDVKVTGTDGTKFIRWDVTGDYVGGTTGGWTDAGSVIYTLDQVLTGDSGSPAAQLGIWCPVSAAKSEPATTCLRLHGKDGSTQDWSWWIDDQDDLVLKDDDGTINVFKVTDSGKGNFYLGDVDAVTLGTDEPILTIINKDNDFNAPLLRIKAGHANQVASLLQIKNAAGTDVLTVDKAGALVSTGSLTSVGVVSSSTVTGTNGTFSGTVQGATVTSTGAVNGVTGAFSGDITTTTDLNARGKTYTWPTSTPGVGEPPAALSYTATGTDAGTLSFANLTTDCYSQYRFQHVDSNTVAQATVYHSWGSGSTAATTSAVKGYTTLINEGLGAYRVVCKYEGTGAGTVNLKLYTGDASTDTLYFDSGALNCGTVGISLYAANVGSPAEFSNGHFFFPATVESTDAGCVLTTFYCSVCVGAR